MRRPEHVMPRRPVGWLVLMLLLAPCGTWAGTSSVRVVPAKVVSAKRVVGYSLGPTGWVAWGGTAVA